jgi:hypothetical protein
MAKILDFFRNKKPMNLGEPHTVCSELTPGVISMSETLKFTDVGNRLYNAMLPHVDFSQWHFIPEFFDLRTTKFRYGKGKMESDIQSTGIVVTALTNIKTKELRFFQVQPFIPELFV